MILQVLQTEIKNNLPCQVLFDTSASDQKQQTAQVPAAEDFVSLGAKHQRFYFDLETFVVLCGSRVDLLDVDPACVESSTWIFHRSACGSTS